MKIFAFLLLVPYIPLAHTDTNIYEKFESKFSIIDGYKINVEVKGSSDPIFFLPGGPGNSHDYMQGNFRQYYKTNKRTDILDATDGDSKWI